MFTAAQRMGVDSKLLVFPDEGHWVLKPQNSRFWYYRVLDWLDKYLK
jgi:dipeptidyl aminopeptidase/acylaminoacyl peptidase